MAQQTIPAEQLIQKVKPIGRCNNYTALLNIPCSPECKIVGQILNNHSLIYALQATADVHAVYLQQFWQNCCSPTLHLPVETPDHLFVAPVDMDTIESFMNHIGYQGVVDKVSALYTKNLAQPWQTMFKVFNRCLTTRTSGHDQTKINILQLLHAIINRSHVDYAALLWWDFINNVFQKKEAIQYPRFIKLIVADLMLKFDLIAARQDEHCHSIKDDIPLISVYTTGNVRVKGMLIPDELLTDDIRVTDDFKEYKAVFENIVGPMTQPQPVVSTQGSNKTTPRADRTPTLSASPQGKKRKLNAGETSLPKQSLKIIIKQKPSDLAGQSNESYDDIHIQDDRIEPGSHKDILENTPTPTPPRSPRKHLSSDKDISHELTAKDIGSGSMKRVSAKYKHLLNAFRRMCNRQGYMIQSMERKCVTNDEFWKVHNKVDHVLHDVVLKITANATNDLIESNLKPKIVQTLMEERDAFISDMPKIISNEFKAHALAIIEELSHNIFRIMDDFVYSHGHDDHQDDDALPEGERRVKKKKSTHSSKSARKSSSKQTHTKATYLIAEFQEFDKHTPTIFNHARMEATLRDAISNQFKDAEEYAYHLEQSTNFMEKQIVWESRQPEIKGYTLNPPLVFYGPQRNPNEPPRYLYNKYLFFLKNGNTEERKYTLSLHKIHGERFPEEDLEEKLKRWVRKEFKNFNEEARLILEVVRITTDQSYGLDFMEQIIVVRENGKPDSFSEADFKYLNKNDIEYLYYLCRNKKINYRETKLLNSLVTFIKSRKTPVLGELDRDIFKAFKREISKRLRHREQMRRWESFVNGRPILTTMKRL
ncbi:hypothetical protein Tco_1040693 [Tanacetum coccineum]